MKETLCHLWINKRRKRRKALANWEKPLESEDLKNLNDLFISKVMCLSTVKNNKYLHHRTKLVLMNRSTILCLLLKCRSLLQLYVVDFVSCIEGDVVVQWLGC